MVLAKYDRFEGVTTGCSKDRRSDKVAYNVKLATCHGGSVVCK